MAPNWLKALLTVVYGTAIPGEKDSTVIDMEPKPEQKQNCRVKPMERINPDVCTYCQQPKTNHAATCAGAEIMVAQTPAAEVGSFLAQPSQ